MHVAAGACSGLVCVWWWWHSVCLTCRARGGRRLIAWARLTTQGVEGGVRLAASFWVVLSPCCQFSHPPPCLGRPYACPSAPHPDTGPAPPHPPRPPTQELHHRPLVVPRPGPPRWRLPDCLRRRWRGARPEGGQHSSVSQPSHLCLRRLPMWAAASQPPSLGCRGGPLPGGGTKRVHVALMASSTSLVLSDTGLNLLLPPVRPPHRPPARLPSTTAATPTTTSSGRASPTPTTTHGQAARTSGEARSPSAVHLRASAPCVPPPALGGGVRARKSREKRTPFLECQCRPYSMSCQAAAFPTCRSTGASGHTAVAWPSVQHADTNPRGPPPTSPPFSCVQELPDRPLLVQGLCPPGRCLADHLRLNPQPPCPLRPRRGAF